MHSFSRSLTPAEQDRVLAHLSAGGYQNREVAHARAAAGKPGLNLVLYESGKLVVQGKATRDWIEFVLEPDILQRHDILAAPAASAAEAPAAPLPRIGMDESGKGDYFGPLMIAAFRLTDSALPLVDRLGIRDSKQIKSARKIDAIAAALHEQHPADCEVLALSPETYNRLISRMGSVNRVLAWGHATVLENLLTRFPDTRHAVADQFGPEHQIRNALKSKGKTISLEQRHRAESDPAVAAASILARREFTRQLRELGEWAGTSLPLGATHVRPTAEDVVRRAGPEVLTRLAKTHFRTTRQVLEACGYDPGLLGTPDRKSSG